MIGIDAIKQRVMADAVQNAGRLGLMQQQARANQVTDFTRDFAARKPEDAARYVASELATMSKASEGPRADATRQIMGAMGLPVETAGQLKPADVQQKLAADALLQAELGRRLAGAQGAGPVQQGLGALIQGAENLADPGARGRVARGALGAAVVGGGVAGGVALTEGAQQLIALMQYLQSGQQSEERAQTSELA